MVATRFTISIRKVCQAGLISQALSCSGRSPPFVRDHCQKGFADNYHRLTWIRLAEVVSTESRSTMSRGQQQQFPLERRQISSSLNGIERWLPALHQMWTVSHDWMPFVPPPCRHVAATGAEEAWLERTEIVLEDLDMILELPYHKFWSQMVHDRGLHRVLGLHLQHLPRRHDFCTRIVIRRSDEQTRTQQLLKTYTCIL